MLVRSAILALLLASSHANAAERRVDASVVLTEARKVSGANKLQTFSAMRVQGEESSGGFVGGWNVVVDLRSGRFEQKSNYGLFATGFTFDGRYLWKTDRSGGVHALNGAYGRRSGVSDGWLARFGYLDPRPGLAQFAYARHEREVAKGFDVVVATPVGGEPVELWFDDATHFLSKTVRRRPLETTVDEYSDYKNVDGLMLPYRIDSKSDANSDVDVTSVANYRFDSAESETEFAPPSQPDDAKLEAPTNVPTEIKTFVTVEAMLNGQGPFSFIVDTGGHNIITPDVAKKLGLNALGSSRSGGSGAETISQQDLIVDSLELGAARLASQHFYVIPLQYDTVERGARPPLAGILGLELFERLAVRISYRERLVTLIPFVDADQQCLGSRIPIFFDADTPLVDGSLQGKVGILAIDTGNAGTTAVQGAWATRSELAEELRAGTPTMSFGTGGGSKNWTTRGGKLSIGDVPLENVYLRLANDRAGASSSITEAGNVGQQVLSNFDVLFDYSRKLMCLTPVPGYLPPPLSRAGFSAIKKDRESFEIESVNRDSAGDRAELKPGDLIVAMDGRAATELSNEDLFKAVRQEPGTVLHLLIMRNGTKQSRTVTLMEP